MNLHIKNIGMIKDATIKLDGLTVIAGENNMGKSTFGKLIFTIIKSISRYKEDLEENKEKNIKNILDKLYFTLRRKVDFSNNIEIKEIFYPPRFFKEIESQNLKAVDRRIEYIESLQSNLFESEGTLNDDIKIFLKKELNQIKSEIKSKDNTSLMRINAFKKALISEFNNEISSKSSSQLSKIDATDFSNAILNITIKENEIKKFDLMDKLYFQDATFIESPIVLQLNESIGMSKTFLELENQSKRIHRLNFANVPLHIKDLHSKLQDSVFGDLFISNILFDEVNADLKDIISGEVSYSEEEKEFIYQDKNGNTHKSINIASGIKSFGIIQMLIKGGFINESSLLILDEPEVHLHPKWQIEYAKIITLLVKNNINVLITSHSPYMIQGLIKFVKENNINEISNFYLMEEEKGFAKCTEVNNNLELIFELLAEPLNRVYE
ncbi:MAG: AAA family ATPase [Campylobacterota bacterium]|nr:AAA family ATPase [Campylobacterota bacterium]